MKASELRQELHERRKSLRRRMRESLPRLREQARERVRSLRAQRKQPANWRRRSMAALLLLLLLLLLRCNGGPPGPALAAASTPSSLPSGKSSPPPFQTSLEHRHRPGFQSNGHPAPDWLDDFRLQVAARSPRLAQCFNGAERSGMFRWTVSVDAASGAVTDHQLEPLRQEGEMGRDQERCVTAALSNPGYRLKPGTKDAMPDRVSLIIEF